MTHILYSYFFSGAPPLCRNGSIQGQQLHHHARTEHCGRGPSIPHGAQSTQAEYTYDDLEPSDCRVGRSAGFRVYLSLTSIIKHWGYIFEWGWTDYNRIELHTIELNYAMQVGSGINSCFSVGRLYIRVIIKGGCCSRLHRHSNNQSEEHPTAPEHYRYRHRLCWHS